MLDEYISLKEQKVILDQERSYLEQEKIRVHALLQGMQTVMSAYNSSGRSSTPSISAAPDKVGVVGQSESPVGNALKLSELNGMYLFSGNGRTTEILSGLIKRLNLWILFGNSLIGLLNWISTGENDINDF